MLNPSYTIFSQENFNTAHQSLFRSSITLSPCTSSFAVHLGPATAGSKGLNRLEIQGSKVDGFGLVIWNSGRQWIGCWLWSIVTWLVTLKQFKSIMNHQLPIYPIGNGQTKSSASTFCVNVHNYILKTGDPVLCTSNQLGKTKQSNRSFNQTMNVGFGLDLSQKNSKTPSWNPPTPVAREAALQESPWKLLKLDDVATPGAALPRSRKFNQKTHGILGDSNGWIHP